MNGWAGATAKRRGLRVAGVEGSLLETESCSEVFRDSMRQALNGETWVVDGNHWEVRDMV